MSQFEPVRFVDVNLEGQFWRERLETVLTRTIPSQHVQLGKHGILESLTLPNPPPPLALPAQPSRFHRAGVLGFRRRQMDRGSVLCAVASARSPTSRQRSRRSSTTSKRRRRRTAISIAGTCSASRKTAGPTFATTTSSTISDICSRAAIAYFLATGRRRLLDILERYVDHVRKTFGPGPDQKHGYCGHQEIELALIRLYHLTGERKQLDLASYFIDQRGAQPHYFDQEARNRGEDPKDFWAKSYEYNQSHKPVREQRKVVGHAVRAMYMYSAMADLAAELKDDSLKRACEVLWADVMASKIYITSGLGPAAANEGFTEDYDLPNDTAYAETCASVALIFWAQRMLHLDMDGKYADVMEQALFNGALTGLARDGEHYFYSNPLDSDGRHSRWAWHTCPCCTMNSSRLVASVGGYFVSHSDDAIAFHLYGGISTSVTLKSGKVGSARDQHLPVVRRYPHRGRAREAVQIHAEAAHSRLGARRHGVGERRAGRGRGRD